MPFSFAFYIDLVYNKLAGEMMIYLDYSATTPMMPEVLDSYVKVNKEYYANINSIHGLGTKSKELYDKAIMQMCEILKINKEELIITSGATESNNIALIGSAFANRNKGNHIIISKLEHDSIYEIVKFLEKSGFKVEYVNNDSDGIIDFEHLKSIITDDTILVSVCAVNSEMGIRQPLKTIKQIITKENHRTLLHSDMTQALGKIPINLSDVDLASMSGHKIYGPEGIGILYKKENITIKPLLHGNKNFKPGTPPLSLIASLSKALRLASSKLTKKAEKISKLNNKITAELKKYPNILINKTKYCIPHILNISLMNIKSDTFINALNEYNIYIGSNTACSSGNISPTVFNIYGDKARALTTLRISISHLTSIDEINTFLSVFDKIYKNLKQLTK